MDRSDECGKYPVHRETPIKAISPGSNALLIQTHYAFPCSNLTLAVPTEAMRSVEAWNVLTLEHIRKLKLKTSLAPEVLPNGRLGGGGINLLIYYDLPLSL